MELSFQRVSGHPYLLRAALRSGLDIFTSTSLDW